ncbi:MAG: PRD domain-containing protein [Enterococcus aquimarinus]|uniref:PRD domain-containing protein n=1 Tax=Enterococcus aquimarinus TaxID=328396 RepID=A0A9E3ZUV2_9ENTE|nr:PRD domain-containing protein [Enterococcus aquimarinus]
MKIEKVYNNNVVLAKSDDLSEIIVMGKGIGFQKKTGDTFDESLVEKTFVIKENDFANQLKAIYQDLPQEESDAIFKIIQEAETRLNHAFQANVYLALADHIHYAIQRTREGINLTNPLSFEVKKFYRREFEIGKIALELIAQHTGVKMAADEATSIALHFVNAEKEGQLIEETMKITRTVQDILNIVRLHYGVDFDTETISYNRFYTHLQYFAQRVVTREIFQVPTDTFLLDQVRANYPEAYNCARKISTYVEGAHRFNVAPDEVVYLTIHIHRVVQLK